MDKNDFIFSKNEPNYCNTPKFPSESYLKMKSELEPPCNAPCPIASALVRNYKEVPGAFSYTNCQLEDTSYTERCDSVPDLPAPSIPVSIYPPNRILPLPCIGAEMPTRLLSPKFRPSTPPKMPTPKPPSPRAPLQNPSHKLTPSQIPTSKPRNKGFPLQKLS